MKFAAFIVMIWAGTAVAQTESLVTGVSQDDVQITADFTGSDILVYGAVRRDSPAPASPPLDVIVTLEGPSNVVAVRRKERRLGIWVNGPATEIGDVPSYFATASTGPLEQILLPEEDLRHNIGIDRRVRVTKINADAMDFPKYVQALLRIRAAGGVFSSDPRGVRLAEETLFRADFALPANLVEGDFRVRLFLLRGGKVLDVQEQMIDVRKTGIERQLTLMAHQQPLLYGLLSLLMAGIAGWGASEVFRLLRR